MTVSTGAETPDRGSGTVLAIAVLACSAAAAIGVATAASVIVGEARTVGAVESAALAGADTVLGHHRGEPCANATRVLAAAGVAEASCRVDGIVVTVAVRARGPGGGAPIVAAAGPADPARRVP